MDDRSLRARRAVVVAVSLLVPLVLVVGLGHRGVHMARNVVFPGAGLIDERPVVALLFAMMAVGATVAWVRWGVDWSVLAVVLLSTAAAGALTSSDAHAAVAQVDRAAHEFPLVLIVAGAITWLRSIGGRVPGVRHLHARRARSMAGLRDIDRLSVVDRCRCGAIAALADLVPGVERDRVMASLEQPAIATRARRVGLVARGRRGGDPFRVDHAHARAALVLAGRLDTAQSQRFVTDAVDAPGGVPASEPGWVRPLDATLAAVALDRLGDAAAGRRWTQMLRGPMSLRRGHRPAFWWTPIGVSAGSAPAWEHAAMAGIARSMGWIGDEDWTALRAPVLGAAARGARVRDDERLIAAGRLLMVGIDDPQAAGIVARPTVQHDPIAVALDRLAARLSIDPGALRSAPRQYEGVPCR